MFQTEMHFYYYREDNKICVQNMVGGMCGQFHKHTPQEFELWKKETEKQFGEEYLHDITK